MLWVLLNRLTITFPKEIKGKIFIANQVVLHELVKFSNLSNREISENLSRSDLAAKDISSSIARVNQFLQEKCDKTQAVAKQADKLSACSEEIFIHLEKFQLESLHSRMCRLAVRIAAQVSKRFEEAVENREITKSDLFDFSYIPIENTNPEKFHTTFDRFTDKVPPEIQEPVLDMENEIIFAGAVDKNGYFPTHNLCYSQPLTGNYEKDIAQNRTKRIFNDPTGARCGSHRKAFLLQTYKRDTGEIMHDVSAPLYVNGVHWGGFRIGFKPGL